MPTLYVDWTELPADRRRRGLSPQAVARALVSAFFGAQHSSDVVHGRTDVVDRWAESSDLLFHAVRAQGELDA
ncbi:MULTISPECIES: hypothetical protein [unclassified Streptomyces]|uniref:hypothetical protein n=1 Tax=unclassified Streptomyces TaxID=2593676 RepID=UPI000DDB469B|nr:MULTISPECIES: hypothetical protein [unclassified Streptomyces]QZZ25513.1 hypothetical protein A7X85_03755 [Streptomyces sp. ST1015]